MRLVGFTATSAANGPADADQVSKLSKKTATEAAQSSTQGGIAEDTTTLTSNGPSAQSLVQAAAQTDPARAARVDSLKQAVSSGQYKLDPESIADSLINADI
jgi:flagellar biosynthesis anti-sigma factor FlgM